MTVSVLVPSSLVRDASDKREATQKIGLVARAATVFRVDRLTVYPDREAEGEFGEGFVTTVLRYAATPPYLRKEVWGTRDELEYAGVLPPLRIATQTGSGSENSGSLRQGIVTEVGSDGRVRVNCGLQHPISLPVPDGMEPGEGERVTVRVSSREPVRAKLEDVSPPGYAVDVADLDTALERPDAGFTIAASRHGERLRPARIDDIAAQCRVTDSAVTAESAGTDAGADADAAAGDGEAADAAGDTDHGGLAAAELTVAFGAPERGLPAILGFDPARVREGHSETGGFDLWLNTVPLQGSEVVRTEEALFATLACLNLME